MHFADSPSTSLRVKENPAKITRVRYLLRYSVTRGTKPKEADFKHPTLVDEGYLKDHTFKQTVTDRGASRQRYIKVFESEDDLQDWTRDKTASLMNGVLPFYVHGSVQAFIGKINSTRLSSSGGGGSIEGKITSAERIWSTGNVNKIDGDNEVDNMVRRSLENLRKLRMKEYKAFEQPKAAKYQKGVQWSPRDYTEPEIVPPVALTKTGLEVFQTKRGTLYHQTSGGNIAYHRHKGSVIHGAQWTTHAWRKKYRPN